MRPSAAAAAEFFFFVFVSVCCRVRTAPSHLAAKVEMATYEAGWAWRITFH
jgi:hypothetical protein